MKALKLKSPFTHQIPPNKDSEILATSIEDIRKETDEEFRKTRDKLMFKEAKKINNINLNSNVKKKENNEIKIENKKIINDDDYMANFNFGEVDDEQLIQQVIEQSLKDQKKKKI